MDGPIIEIDPDVNEIEAQTTKMEKAISTIDQVKAQTKKLESGGTLSNLLRNQSIAIPIKSEIGASSKKFSDFINQEKELYENAIFDGNDDIEEVVERKISKFKAVLIVITVLYSVEVDINGFN